MKTKLIEAAMGCGTLAVITIGVWAFLTAVGEVIN